MSEKVGGLSINKVTEGDCRELISLLPDESVDVVVTSPPYWGQRTSGGTGVEEDPREYVEVMGEIFTSLLPKMTKQGTLWLNVGDAYNTPVNWATDDYTYSTLGADKKGLNKENSAYTKNRHKRKAFVNREVPWLTYGNLLALPYRIVESMCDSGWLFRGEVIWRKANAMPEGRCRRPHRKHESIYLMARSEKHLFRVSPPVPSVWDIANEHLKGEQHRSRFPLALPTNCIEASAAPEGGLVLDPFSGSGTTGIAAIRLGLNYVGFEIDPVQVEASNARLRDEVEKRGQQSL